MTRHFFAHSINGMSHKDSTKSSWEYNRYILLPLNPSVRPFQKYFQKNGWAQQLGVQLVSQYL